MSSLARARACHRESLREEPGRVTESRSIDVIANETVSNKVGASLRVAFLHVRVLIDDGDGTGVLLLVNN